jgi:hypothetical protein
MFLLEKGTHAEHRTGSPLTLATMADAYNIRIGGYFDTQAPQQQCAVLVMTHLP